MGSGKTGRIFSYAFLTLSIVPILVGYTWLVVATVSTRTRGLLPINAEGGIGGLTLGNWDFVFEGAIWSAMLNSLLIAIAKDRGDPALRAIPDTNGPTSLVPSAPSAG